MACGCKNKTVKANSGVVKSRSSQETSPQKVKTGSRIIKREIR